MEKEKGRRHKGHARREMNEACRKNIKKKRVQSVECDGSEVENDRRKVKNPADQGEAREKQRPIRTVHFVRVVDMAQPKLFDAGKRSEQLIGLNDD